jgi:hypothetical protein
MAEKKGSGLWSWLTRSLGLLGKPYRVTNEGRSFGANQSYILVQLEAPGDLVVSTWKGCRTFSVGEEFVIALTENQFLDAIVRAERNPEDVRRFLEDHVAQDAVD